MTSIRNDYVFTPELRKMTQDLREKYGKNVRVSPMTEPDLQLQRDCFVRSDVKSDLYNETDIKHNLSLKQTSLKGSVDGKNLEIIKNKGGLFSQSYSGLLDNKETSVKIKFNNKFEGKIEDDTFNLKFKKSLFGKDLKLIGTINNEDIDINIKDISVNDYKKHSDIYSLCLGITGYNVTPNNQGKLTASLTKSKAMELAMMSAVAQQQQMQQHQMQQHQILQNQMQMQQQQMQMQQMMFM